MCEPYHSITQFPPHDDKGDPTRDRVVALSRNEGFVQKWFKKIKGWFHLSKMGAGHSESVGRIHHSQRLYLPNTILWEGAWWNRELKLDGLRVDTLDFQNQRDEAEECAEHYFQMVCAGHIQKLRQFLETSLSKTDRNWGYIDRFMYDFLNRKGREKFQKKLNLANTPKQLTKYLLGFTRKRDLIVPEWADVDELWLPGQRVETT